ncbi:MAG TPA: hypothetical protein VLF20_00910 [Patescibacteria group bacterium]|nr:hypothetical protein [Patescibacteria group bacterium]
MQRISFLFSFFSVGLFYFFARVTAFAAPVSGGGSGSSRGNICPTGEFKPLCNLDLTNSSGIVGSVVTILLVFGVIIALIFLIIGAIRWITSSGDKAKLESARGTIVAAIIGLILAFSAYFILNLIMYFFLGNTIRNFSIPTIVNTR